MGKVIACIGMAVALAGCATTGGSFCGTMTDETGTRSWLRTTPGDVEVVSTELATGLVTVYRIGEKTCGWKPASK